MHDAYKSYVYIVNDQGVVERRDVTLGNTCLLYTSRCV